MGDHNISDEEKALFRQMVGETKPIASKKIALDSARPPPTQKPHQKPLKKTQTHRSHPTHHIYLSSSYEHPVTPSQTLSYRVKSIPEKRLKKLRKGQLTWSKRLDLHGQTIEHAKDALRDFIVTSYESNQRCLLIIHGKGGYLNDVSLLKSYVNHWLKQIDWVLAFHSACPKDGGTGALYVLLKNNRDMV